jgi:VanZ family protein
MLAWLHAWRWHIWILYSVVWTVALLAPEPEIMDGDSHSITLDRKFVVAKAAHVGAYCAWTVLTAWLRAPLRYRFLLVFVLMAHATVTEVLQYATELGRIGALLDVAFDHLGVALGLIATWPWWFRE